MGLQCNVEFSTDVQKGGVGGVCAIFFIKLLKTCKMYRTSTHPITGNSHWSEIIKQQQVTSKLLSPPFPRVLEPTRIHANNIHFYLIGTYHSLVSPTALLLLFFLFFTFNCLHGIMTIFNFKKACMPSFLIGDWGGWYVTQTHRLMKSVTLSLYQFFFEKGWLSIHKFKI